ncbi:MAG: hypothetical protein ACE5F1_06485 [Planctomycetota bacterium]
MILPSEKLRSRVRLHAERVRRIRMLSLGLAREFARHLERRPSIGAAAGWELKNIYGPLQFWIQEPGSPGGRRIEIRLAHGEVADVLFQAGPYPELDA